MNMFMGAPAKLLCKQHLLGVHGELHKFLRHFAKKRSIDGYIKNNCMEPSAYKRRHDEVAREMTKRGMNHKSPLEQPDFSYLPERQKTFVVDRQKSLNTLLARCAECRKRSAPP